MKLRTVSWIMLTVLGSFVLLASFLATYLAYRGDYAIGGTAVGAVGGALPPVSPPSPPRRTGQDLRVSLYLQASISRRRRKCPALSKT